MMDAIVQFIRNALCCIKDLHLFPDTFIHEAKFTHMILSNLPPPLDETTPLEVIISITQLYACITVAKSGFNLCTSSIGKLKRILRIVEYRMTNTTTTNKQEEQSEQSQLTREANRLVNESLLKEARMAFRMVWIGFFVAPIGVCFWWLFINSWHITSVNWFGGLPALIHALEVMEVCLLPLLFYMIKDGMEMLTKGNNTQLLLKQFVNASTIKDVHPSSINIQNYETMTGWVPFWDNGISVFSTATVKEIEQVEKEVTTVNQTLELWFGNDEDGKKKKDDGEKEDKIRQTAIRDVISKLESAIPKYKLEGYREFIYFFLNFIAFYGYLMAPLTFYWNDDNDQPYHIQSMKLWYRNDDADWTGNFAGDLCWTIEPIVILGSPFIVSNWTKKPSTTDSDGDSTKVKAE